MWTGQTWRRAPAPGRRARPVVHRLVARSPSDRRTGRGAAGLSSLLRCTVPHPDSRSRSHDHPDGGVSPPFPSSRWPLGNGCAARLSPGALAAPSRARGCAGAPDARRGLALALRARSGSGSGPTSPASGSCRDMTCAPAIAEDVFTRSARRVSAARACMRGFPVARPSSGCPGEQCRPAAADEDQPLDPATHGHPGPRLPGRARRSSGSARASASWGACASARTTARSSASARGRSSSPRRATTAGRRGRVRSPTR
jgi:hypothetical protein